MSITRKEYAELGSLMKQSLAFLEPRGPQREGYLDAILDLSTALKSMNPKMNRAKFLEASGYPTDSRAYEIALKK